LFYTAKVPVELQIKFKLMLFKENKFRLFRKKKIIFSVSCLFKSGCLSEKCCQARGKCFSNKMSIVWIEEKVSKKGKKKNV
jgi:hypothetical protein